MLKERQTFLKMDGLLPVACVTGVFPAAVSHYTLNSFVFLRVMMFPETKSRETLGLEGKQKLNSFQRDHNLSALLHI